MALPTALYPGSAAAAANLFQLIDLAPGTTLPTLASGINNSVTTISVAAGTGVTLPDGTFLILIDSELINIASRSTDTLTVAASGRGSQGTAAASHSSGATVNAFINAVHHNQLASEIIAVEGDLTGAHIPLPRTGVNSSAKRWEGCWRYGVTGQAILNGVENGNGVYTAATTSLPGMLQNWAGNVRGQLQFLTGKNIHWFEFGRLIGTGLTTITRWWGGISDGNSVGTGSLSDTPSGKYAMFRFTVGTDTNYKCATSDGSTQTIADSGIVADGNAHYFEIQMNDSTPNVVFSIDGVVVATITTHLPGNGVLMLRGWNVDGGSSGNNFAEFAFYIESDPSWP